ncbi:hypothetical protein [Streptomyces sp. NPDC058255]|uniref:AbiJ-related protein n=1 Tax=Streptomyces sp. NPDC058255 TaxID=3346407 RepID=UPI0036EDBE76
MLVNGTRPVTLRDRIERHVFRNPGDWSTEDLFDNLGVFEAGDARLARFLEGLVSADVLLDEHLQEKTVSTINGHLRTAGVELRVTGNYGGYPVFTVVSTRLPGTRRPKNIIFASFTKPDIRFRSSVDNDIEIVGGNPDDTLVYDREVPIGGLRWRDLHAWWQDAREISSETEAPVPTTPQEPARQLGRPEKPLHRLLPDPRALPGDPALLPEVWLHWDHRIVKERGPEALLRSRMDFLLLLPHGQRVVLEVDGSQHYTRDRGRTPDTGKYADMVAADRDLKLRGYEVFRFRPRRTQASRCRPGPSAAVHPGHVPPLQGEQLTPSESAHDAPHRPARQTDTAGLLRPEATDRVAGPDRPAPPAERPRPGPA